MGTTDEGRTTKDEGQEPIRRSSFVPSLRPEQALRPNHQRAEHSTDALASEPSTTPAEDVPVGERRRLFVAIRIPERTQARLAAVRHTLGNAGGEAWRWVRPEGMHLTLVFLGNTADEQVPAIEEALNEAARRARPLTLTATGLGCFPSAGRPRVLWAGLAGDTKGLAALQQDIDARLRWLGLELEARPFRPHVTLARLSGPLSPEDRAALAGRLQQPASSFGRWRAEAVELIHSRLHPKGSVYTTIYHAALGARAGPASPPLASSGAHARPPDSPRAVQPSRPRSTRRRGGAEGGGEVAARSHPSTSAWNQVEPREGATPASGRGDG